MIDGSEILTESNRHNFDDHLKDLQFMWNIAQQKMGEAQDAYSIQYNRDHRDTTFQVNGLVMVKKNAYNNGAYTKFHHLWYGPFKIIEKISDVAFKLELPDSAKKSRRHPTHNIKASKRYFPRIQHNEIKEQLNQIEKAIEIFKDATCEVRWKNAEVCDTTIIPVQWVKDSTAAYLLRPFLKDYKLQCFRLDER